METVISQFKCPGCGNIIPIPRRRSRQRPKGHIKDLYCPWCKKIQKTLEYHENEPIRSLDGSEW